jgi:hypothetical protein
LGTAEHPKAARGGNRIGAVGSRSGAEGSATPCIWKRRAGEQIRAVGTNSGIVRGGTQLEIFWCLHSKNAGNFKIWSRLVIEIPVGDELLYSFFDDAGNLSHVIACVRNSDVT